jgi:hypothetical protein
MHVFVPLLQIDNLRKKMATFHTTEGYSPRSYASWQGYNSDDIYLLSSVVRTIALLPARGRFLMD